MTVEILPTPRRRQVSAQSATKPLPLVGHVTSVQKGVDIHPIQPLAAGQLQQGVQMLNMGVDAAVGQQAAQVQPGSLLQAVIHRLVIGFVGKRTCRPRWHG